jgi:uncharacterized protein YaaN involved in tellurite resistance
MDMERQFEIDSLRRENRTKEQVIEGYREMIKALEAKVYAHEVANNSLRMELSRLRAELEKRGVHL